MATQWKQLPSHPVHDDVGTPLFDPYYAWAELTGFQFLGGKPKVLPVLLELNITVREFASLSWDTQNESLGYMRISPFYRDPVPPLQDATFCTAVVTLQFFVALRDASKSLGKVVKRFELGVPFGALDASPFAENPPSNPPATDRDGKARQPTPQQSPSAQAGGAVQVAVTGNAAASTAACAGPVFVGVIDDGIAFAHERFRDQAMSSRIEAYWDQDLPPQPSGKGNPLFNFGWTYSKSDFTQMFALCTHAGVLDEDDVYRRAGLRFDLRGHNAIARRAAHGTHVMDLACGLDPANVTTQSPRIIAVKLRDVVTEQTSGAQLTFYALASIAYILYEAWQAGRVPVVINMSYGITSGPHDGTTLLERAMDEIIRLCWTLFQWRVSIVLPAGNSNLTRHHALLDVPAGSVKRPGVKTMDWLVLPDDRTPSFLEVWLPCDAPQGQIAIEVTTPDGTRSGGIKEGQIWVWPSTGAPLCTVDYVGFGGLGSRRMALISLYPTASIVAGQATAPSGIWTVSVRNPTNAIRKVDGWIRRDDNAFGYPIVGRQSRFEDPDYVRIGPFGLPQQTDVGPSYVKRSGSINGIATGVASVVVAGCRSTDLAPAPYSAIGPATQPQGCGPASRPGPDVMAPVEHSVACHGILAAGTRSGSTIAMNGTSVAAPQIARYLAGIMQSGGAGDGADARAEAVLQEGNRALLIPPLDPMPNIDRQGSGRVELPPAQLPPANLKRPPQFR